MNKLILLVLIIPVLSCNSDGDNSFSQRPKSPPIPKQVLSSLQEGDFMLRQGNGAFSEKIIEYMGEEQHFSHIGLVARLDGKLKVIHSVSEELSGRDGVQITTIEEFASDVGDSNFCAVRPKLDSVQISQLIQSAKYYLDKQTTFDYDYNTDDSTQLYCIELMYYALGAVIGKDKFEFRRSKDGTYIPLFTSFLNPEYFDILYCLKP